MKMQTIKRASNLVKRQVTNVGRFTSPTPKVNGFNGGKRSAYYKGNKVP